MDLWNVEGIGFFLALLPVVAFLYAVVGHGGASGYLALMALWSFPVSVMKPTALVLNLFVAAISFFAFARKMHFKKELFIPFAITSIPLAFLGGMIELDVGIYRKFLAVLLVFAILKLLGVFGKESEATRRIKTWQGLVSGGLIGFFSGLIGIGGGVVLTPLILIMRWGTMKQAAAISAAFIWVNSAAGLAGHYSRGISIEPQAFILVGIALIGGIAGGFLGSGRLNNAVLRKMLAVVLVIACLKLIFT